ncbi:toll-like receptor 13 [Chironomus tepperi]|uniref:toll-like receptor 13 n=1 Tax=Chironomus tepperi TaxID=113505 RepID=UPI00391EEAAF
MMNLNIIKTMLILIISDLNGIISCMEHPQPSIKCELTDFYDSADYDCFISPVDDYLWLHIKDMNDTDVFLDIPDDSKNRINFMTFGHNSVQFLPKDIHKYAPNLEKISAFGTSIKKVSRHNFMDLKSLVEIEITDGELTDICGTAFNDLKSLESIDLSKNEIKFLHPNLFKGTDGIKDLNLKQNSIDILHPMIFSGLSSLLTVDLSYNDILFIDKRQFLNNRLLRTVSLADNPLKVVEFGAFVGFFNLNVLDIGGTPCAVTIMSDVDETIKILGGYCSQISSDDQHEIQQKIDLYNKWLGGKYVADMCGSDDQLSYIPNIVGSQDNSSIKLHIDIQLWTLVCLILALNVNYWKTSIFNGF